MFHCPTPNFSKSPWAIANNGFTKRVGTHAFLEGIHNHGLLRRAHFHHLGPEAVDILLQTLPLVLLHIKQIVGDRRRGPVRQVLLSEQLGQLLKRGDRRI